MDNRTQDQLNILPGVYALADGEAVIVQQAMATIQSYQQELERLSTGLFQAVAKFAGVPTDPNEAQHYAFGAAHGQLVVFDTRKWVVDEEKGLVSMVPNADVVGPQVEVEAGWDIGEQLLAEIEAAEAEEAEEAEEDDNEVE